MSAPTPSSPCSCTCGASFRAVTLGLLVFLLGAVATIYLKYRMGATDAYEQQRAAKRVEARLKIEGEAKELLTTSSWVDQAKGTVRIPLEDAMALEVVALKQKQPRAATYRVGAPVPVPASALPAPVAAPAAAPATTAPKTATTSAPAAAPAPAPTATASAPATAQPTAPKK